MMSVSTLVILFVINLCLGFASTGQSSEPAEGIRTVVILGQANYTYQAEVNSSVQYVYQYTFNTSSYGRNGDVRVHTHCDSNQHIGNPVMFVVRQQESVVSWQLPQQSKSALGTFYYKSSRTLCSELADEEKGVVLVVFVTVSTASKESITVNISVSVEQSFIMTLGQQYNTTLSPPSPRFYRFLFSDPENLTFPITVTSQYVLLEVLSDDLICMTVSVQNSTCPVFDEESNVQFEGYWQTMSKKAGMTLRRDHFPLGFYVVFVMHSDDSRCVSHDGRKAILGVHQRRKSLTFTITEKITYMEYLGAIFGLIAIFLLFYVLAILISICHCFRSISNIQFPVDEDSGRSLIIGNGETSASSTICGGVGSENEIPGTSAEVSVTTNPIRRNTRGLRDAEGIEQPHWLADSDSSLDETEIDMLEDVRREKDIYRTSTSLCVSALARKNPRVLEKKSQLYLWTLITVAIFYSIPVLQLVFTYQNVLHTTGNTDLCYYNYLCSHPLWMLSDFNHVYSNIGYILLGFLFIFIVYRRDRMHQKRIQQNQNLENYGIPRHFGFFYTMGLALVMEGFLSACYHVCPNASNFQFDTCFMYVIALMCILKIYQTRHPDINASAYATFTALAFVVLIGVLGVMAGNIFFWGLFTAAHVVVCFILSFQIYYLGRWRLDCGLFRRVYGRWKNDCLASPITCLRPLYIDRMILLSFANCANWTIAAYGIYNQSPDFASHLLLIFMSNLFIYMLFYIVMKLTHREKILPQPLTYIILTWISWSVAIWIFLQRSTSWQMSPAESRTFNRECAILRFYDTHDIWHAVSSIGLFVWYMVLLTLDDDLMETPRDRIAVF